MTDNVRAILHPPFSPPPSAEGGSSSLPPSASSSPSHYQQQQQQLHQQQHDDASLTTALNATFRFALPDECLPARGLEAVEWLAKGPPRVRKREGGREGGRLVCVCVCGVYVCVWLPCPMSVCRRGGEKR